MTYMIHPDMNEHIDRWSDRIDRFLLFGNYDVWKERQGQHRELKFCFIRVGKTQIMAMTDKITGKVYKIDSQMCGTWMEWKYYEFVRYARSFDV